MSSIKTLLAVALAGLLPLHAQSIVATPSSIGNLTTTLGNPSPSQSFTLNGSGLTAPITLLTATPFEVSSNNSSFGSALSVPKPGGTIQSVYYGDITTATGKIWSAGNGGQIASLNAFAAITSNGSVVAWGSSQSGGSLGTAAGSLSSNVTAIFSSSYAFAALKANGSVVTWGGASYGGNSTSVAGSLTSNVSEVFSTSGAFAALKNDGSVVTWGNQDQGGNSTAVAGSLTSNVTTIFSTGSAFAAFKNDGSVVTWGSGNGGGNSTSVAGNLTSNVAAIYSHSNAFAALKNDGSVVTWGASNTGGDSSSVAASLSSNVTSVFSNVGAFAALKNNGSVVTWGFSSYIANFSAVASSLSSNVTTVYSSAYAFAALKNDGSVVTWGDAAAGGNSTAVAGSLSSNVTKVFSSFNAFAALKTNGSVVTWGNAANGGDSTTVASNLAGDVIDISSTAFAFAALKSDGSVVTWGNSTNGGNSTAVASSLSSNVTAVYSNQNAFAALKKDGSVVTWGSSTAGGSGGPANIGAAGTLPATIFARIGSAPGQAGPVSGNITLDSPGAPTQIIPLSGTVLSPAAISLSGNLSFGQILVGQNATRDFSISNIASSGPALTISSIASSNSSFSLLGNTSNLTVPPSASQNVTVRFQPGAASDFAASITVTSNAGTNSLLATGRGAHTRIIGLSGNLSFGNATVNSTTNGTLSITNTGSGNLIITGINYPAGFSGNFSGTIAAGATQNVTVAFRPASDGSFGGNITVNSDATSGTSTISASGSGVHTRIIGLSGNLSFGNATVNATSTGTLSITNTGSGNLMVTGINYPEGFSGDFSGTVAPGATQNVTVVFRPGSEGSFGGNITVNSDSTSGTSTIAAIGSGVHSRIIGLSGKLSFGNATVNATSNRTLSITNTGTGNLTINSISYPPGFSGNFSGTIASGATQNVTVAFRPASNGNIGGNITVNSNATSGTSTIAASGTGISPFSFTGDLSFQNVTVNQTANRTISINNNTSSSLAVSMSPLPAWLSANATGNFTLAANASRSVTFTFRPAADLAYSSNVTFSSTQGSATLVATGTGVHTRIIGLSGNFSFGSIAVNSTANRTLSITNTGTGNLTVNSISCPPGFSGNFSGTIASGATQNVTVAFRPASNGNIGGNITVNSNATSGTSTIAASGTGISPFSFTGDLSFGNVTVNQKANRTIAINNNTSGSITVSVSAPPAWLKDNLTGNFTLAGNASRTVAYTFLPVAEQAYSSNITFSSSQGNATLAASGSGVHTRIIGLSGNLSFGTIGANTTANRTLTIENTGTGNLTVTGISMPNSFSGNWTGTIAPGTTRNVTVSFRPTTRGEAGGNITVFSNFTSGSAGIPVSGRGVTRPVIDPPSEILDYLRVGEYFEHKIFTANDDADSYGADPVLYNGSTRNPGLPEGLSLNATTGIISGFPVYPLPLTSNITATNVAGTGKGKLVFKILPGVVTLFGENKSRSLDFGNVPIGATITRNITVENLTNDSITVDRISTASLSFTGNLSINPLIISKKSSRLVRVKFTPALKIAYDARITVETSLGDFIIPATGTGVPGSEINLTGNFSFGNAILGTPRSSNLTIRNNGDLPFTVSSITYPPGFSGNWSSGTIQPYTSRNLTVTFAPTAHQTYGGNITVNSDATSGNPRIAASGTGTPSRILGLTGNLSFGSVGVNAQEVLFLTIRNSGSGDLAVSNISYPSGFEGMIPQSGNPVTIASNTSWNLPVYFKPTATQGYGGNITLTTDATSGNSIFPVSGTGISSPVVSLTGNLSFGSVVVNGTLTRNLTITNTGTANLTVTGLTYPAAFSGNASGNFTLAPNGSRNVAVTFRPASIGNFTGNISVNSNAKSGTNSIVASGVGAPAITLKVYSTMSDGSLYEENNMGFIGGADRFGRIGVNQTANLTLSFKNNSSAPATVTIPTLPSWLTLNATGSFTVAANATRNVTATFRPPDETLQNKMPGYSANITFTPNSGPPITVAAFGSGFHTRIIGFSGNLSFGNVTVNSTLTRNLTISNTGSDTLKVSKITFPSSFSGNSSDFSLAPNATRVLAVTFRPSAPGNLTQSIYITSNATSGTSTTRDQSFVAKTTITVNGTAVAK